MRSLKFRIGGAAAVAMMAAAVVAADPTLSADLGGKAIEADLAHLGKLVDLAKTKKVGGRVKSAAVLLALYSQDQMAGKDGAKMAGLRDAALKFAVKAKSSAAITKDAAAFAADAAALATAAPAAGAKPVEVKKIIEDSKLELHELMDLFSSAAGGGMNLEKDIQAIKKNGVKDVAAAELIGARTALIADLTLHLPNDKAAGAAGKKQWEDYSKEMKKFALDLAAEAGKGAKGDLAKMKTAAGKLDASCTNCHNKFRAD